MFFIFLDIRTRISLFFPFFINMLHGPVYSYFPFYKEFDGVLSEWFMDTEVMSMESQAFRVDLRVRSRKDETLDIPTRFSITSGNCILNRCAK
jgi:hypothetical protein